LVEVNPSLPQHMEMVEYIKGLGFEYDEQQVDKARRKDGTFKGVAEYVFTKPHGGYDKHIASVIDRSKLEQEPFNYIYVENVFPEDVYNDLIKELKTIKYQEIEKSRGTKGYPLRYTADVPEHIKISLCSGQIYRSLLTKFLIDPDYDSLPKRHIEDVLLVRDLPGYAIPPHTDSTRKVITVLIYLPQDDTIQQEGTSIFTPKENGFTCKTGRHYSFDDFDKVKTMPFKPNSMFAFARTGNSFHGVEPSQHERNVLLYNINRKS